MTPSHVIPLSRLPAPGAYVTAWKRIKALPDAAQVLLGRMDGIRPAAEVRADFGRALDRRINSRGGDEAANVPMDIDLVRDARDLDDMVRRRIRVYQFRTPLMRERFGHLLASSGD